VGRPWCNCKVPFGRRYCILLLISFKGHNLDGYIYFLGVLGDGAPGANYSDVFCGRVAPGSQTILSAYQYWNGTGWSPDRLYYPNYNGWAPASVFQGVPQGSITYNNYYNCYVYLYPGPPLSGGKS
jgi:hypothetical protein